jgi:hypothetical protein
MRIAFKACVASIASAALVGATTLSALAAPHGGGMGGFGGASFAGARGGGPSFAGARGGPSFAGARGGFSHTMTFARGAGTRTAGFGSRSSRAFATTAGSRFGGTRTAGVGSRGSRALATTAGSRFGGTRTALGAGRTTLASNGFSGRGALTNTSVNGGWRGGDFGWRGGFDRDRFGFDFDDFLWPIGLGLAFDWAVGYPACPYWDFWYGWCGGPYPAAYWGYGAYPWGPPYGWGPAYAWDAIYVPGYDYGYGYGYGWNDWAPAAYGPPVGYAVWTPAYGYAGYDGGCMSRHRVWDPAVGAYVVRREYYDCWA